MMTAQESEYPEGDAGAAAGRPVIRLITPRCVSLMQRAGQARDVVSWAGR